MQAGWCHQAAKQLLKPGASADFQVKGKPEIVPSKAPLGVTGVMATRCGKRFHGVQSRKRLMSKRFVEGDSKKHIIIILFLEVLNSSQSF